MWLLLRMAMATGFIKCLVILLLVECQARLGEREKEGGTQLQRPAQVLSLQMLTCEPVDNWHKHKSMRFIFQYATSTIH
jgi:hypothetical protein